MNKRLVHIITAALLLIGIGSTATAQTVGGNVYGGGKSANVNGNTNVKVNHASATVAKVFGGGQAAGTTAEGTATVTIANGNVSGGVYGGCDAEGTVTGDITVNVEGGTVGTSSEHADVYGGGYGHSTYTSGNVTVTINSTTIWGDVYGGSALGQVGASGKTTTVTFNNGTLEGRIFGGGMGQSTPTEVSATVSGDVHVRFVDGNLKGGIYGGCNERGSVAGNIAVDVNGGTIGAGGSRANIFGGGLGASTTTSGDVAVTFGAASATHSATPTLYGDLYGGSGYGNVNGSSNTTTVTVLNGEITGSVYGGGLGDNSNPAAVNGNVEVNIGKMDGTTRYGQVKLFTYTSATGEKGGKVFGCNNTNGSPKKDVAVNIYSTAHGDAPATNLYPTGITTAADLDANAAIQTYAIAAVFGGGNEASYNPTTANSTTTVKVYACDNTIGDVYGGCNMADVGTTSLNANTEIEIVGGRIHRVFGGGNGTESIAANTNGKATTVVKGGLIDQIFGCGNINGSVKETNLSIAKSGDCDQVFGEVFGGSNQAILATNLNTTIECGDVKIGSLYGGNNLANITGSSNNVVLNVKGGDYTYVFGGSKGRADDPATPDNEGIAANIEGNVTLNLYGGAITNAFGGSDINGNILGDIVVNMMDEEKSGCALSVTNVYGAGNLTAYTPSSVKSYPQVNIIHGTVANVFGGGYGSTAAVTSNPTVRVGYDATDMSSIISEYTQPAGFPRSTVTGNVYGGGYLAAVNGATAVTVQNATTSVANDVYAGGNKADVTGNTTLNLTAGTVSNYLYGGGALANVGKVAESSTDSTFHRVNVSGGSAKMVFGGGMGQSSPSEIAALVNGNTQVTVTGGTFTGDQINTGSDVIKGALFGGCNERGTVLGNTKVIITATVGASNNNVNVYGGGLGANTNVQGSSRVAVGSGNTAGTVYGDVYGGSAKGLVNYVYGSTTNPTTGANITTGVTLTAGTVSGNIYGGGHGIDGAAANVGRDVVVTVSDGTVNSLYGCNNLAGAPQGTAHVNLSGSGVVNRDVYGGGNLADASCATEVNIAGGTVSRDVYGGGAYANTGNTTVNVSGGTVAHDIYGGGLGDGSHSPSVGTVTVNIGGGTLSNTAVGGVADDRYGDATIGGNVYGCNNTAGEPTGNVLVNIFSTAHTPDNDVSNTTGGYAIANVFGGGKNASFTASGKKSTVIVYACDNTIGTVFGGGDAANVPGTVVEVYGGRIESVFGGGNGAGVGNPGAFITESGTNVQVHGGNIGGVYGGSNESGTITGPTITNVDHTGCDQNIEEIFGGGKLVEVNNDIETTIECGTTGGAVYGGCDRAEVHGNVTLNIMGGQFREVYGGSKGVIQVGSVGDANYVAPFSANIDGNVTLNLYGGKLDNVYGGSNRLGNIGGIITVNVLDYGYGGNLPDDDPDNCALVIHNIYGGGNLTHYTPTDATAASPVINLIHGTVSTITNAITGAVTDGNVFGGSEGGVYNNTTYTAPLTANPTVNIGYYEALDTYDSGILKQLHDKVKDSAGYETPPAINSFAANVQGNVYGGGDLSLVNGSTQINIRKETGNTTLSGSVYAGGNKANVSGNTAVTLSDGTVAGDIYGGGALANVGTGAVNSNPATTHSVTISKGSVRAVYGGGMGSDIAALVNGNTQVSINGGSITGGANGAVFGGCNINGTVLGNASVAFSTGGTVGAADARANVYGGGLGEKTNVQGSVSMTLGTGSAIYGDVYGGSAKGLVNCTVDNSDNKSRTADAVTAVTLDGATVTGDIYGGGHGIDNKHADVWGPVTVTINSGSVVKYGTDSENGGNVFGCNNAAGAPQDTVQVYINNNVSGNVFGGGNVATYSAPAGHPNCPKVYILNGTVAGNVFGGGLGSTAVVTANPVVNINGGVVTGNTFGGGSRAPVTGNPTVYAKKGTSSAVFGGGLGESAVVTGNTIVVVNQTGGELHIDSVFGGGDAASVIGATDVQLTAGSVITAFGGGNRAGINKNVSGATGSATVTLTNGTVASALYGGCNVQGTVQGDITVDLNGGSVGIDGTTTDVVFGGGKGHNTNTSGDVAVTLDGTDVYGNLYGGSALGSVGATTKYTTVNLSSATLHGSVFGGGMGEGSSSDGKATTLGNAIVNINVQDDNITGIYGGANFNGHVAGDIDVNIKDNVGAPASRIDVYGGGYGVNTTTGADVTVTVDNETDGAPIIYGDIYGGSAFGQVSVSNKNTRVYFNEGTLNGTIFGGGKGDANTSAIVNGDVQVTVADGAVIGNAIGTDASSNTIGGAVFGGCNVNGAVNGDVNVDLASGTIGTSASHANVYGGGLGEKTNVKGSSNVDLCGATLYGDLYGGSAQGLVNCTFTGTTPGYTGNDAQTIVAVSDGHVWGNIYGGGHGIDGKEADVWGPVAVNINGGSIHSYLSPQPSALTYGGNVYGCNNAAGSPKQDVLVNIYATAHGDTTSTNKYPTVPPQGYDSWTAEALAANSKAMNATDKGQAQAYAIAAVYGGGNQAAYVPTGKPSGTVYGTTVHIYNCENTIKQVFGGGNAANVGSTSVNANTNVIVDGGRINQLFGGGNGAGTGNPGANIYGVATTTLYAGLIDQVFGGSNEKGDINETHLNLSHKDNNTCDVFYGEVFGAGNMANLTGDLITTVYCNAGNFGEFYGGANRATITGNVTLNILGGIFNEVYGGSKGVENGIAADIDGNVTLNLHGGKIGKAFGGSNKNGNVTGLITVNMLDYANGSCALDVNNIYGGSNITAYTPTGEPSGTVVSPVVNIINGTVKSTTQPSALSPQPSYGGNVFGGALGAAATVTASPQVNIGYDAATMGTTASSDSDKLLYKLLHNPNINYTAPTTDPSEYKAIVQGNVYGGGDLAKVIGNTYVNLRNAKNANVSATNVFGGGNEANVSGSTSVAMSGGTVVEDIYGGGALAHVNIDETVSPAAATTGAKTSVTVSGGQARMVFGGGKGSNSSSTSAFAYGNTEVTISGGTITGDKINTTGDDVYGAVYGGCNERGTVMGNSQVNITGTVGSSSNNVNVYGGGLGQNTNVQGSSSVVVGSVDGTTPGTVNGDVYGGSAKGWVNYAFIGDMAPTDPTTADGVTTTVRLTAGSVSGNIYGGGHGIDGMEANVGREVVVSVSGGTVTNLYGGNNLAGAPQSAVQVNLSGNGLVNNDIYGGGNLASANSATEVNIAGGRVSRDVYGGGAFASTGNTTVNVTGGIIGTDGNNATGNIYGGGLGGNYNSQTYQPSVGEVHVNIGAVTQPSTGSPDDTVGSATIHGNVYGCNNVMGHPTGDVYVDVYKTATPATGYAIANLFGGGNLADFKVENKKSYVYIHNCYNSVGRLFGGGNNADSWGVVTTIEGGDFDYVFGGGNGEGDGNKANIGLGGASLTIMGGHVGQFFGGSNEHGEITGALAVNVTDGSCGLDIDNFFCGSNKVPIAGDVITTITCNDNMKVNNLYGGSNQADIGGNVSLTVEGGTYRNVFGGSKGDTTLLNVNNISWHVDKPANIGGNVTLTLKGGVIDTAYGGSDVYGNINGLITVVVDSIGGANNSCPLELYNVYGAGRNAEYKPVGVANAPVVLVNNGTVSKYKTIKKKLQPTVDSVTIDMGGNVFGGGYGTTAVVNANPQVIVGDVAHADLIAKVDGDVYGGGDAAHVKGTPYVKVQKDNTVIGGSVYGGGNAADVYATVIDIYGGTIRNVFGGGHGDTTSGHIKYGNVNGTGTDMGKTDIDIYGGNIRKVFTGCNLNGEITGTSEVDVNKNGTSPLIVGEVYGGGNMASSNAGTINVGCTGSLTSDHSSHPENIGITLEGIGTVYGGANQADIGTKTNHSDITVNINSGIVGNVFGGNNTSGDIYGNIVVNIEQDANASCKDHWYVGNVYGGGNLAQYINDGGNYPEVNILRGTVSGNVYGGGMGNNTDDAKLGLVTSNPVVNIGAAGKAPVVKGNVYGGGALAQVGFILTNDSALNAGNTTVNIVNGTVQGSVFGGGAGTDHNFIKALVMGNATVNMTGGNVKECIYGGGEVATVGYYKFSDIVQPGELPDTCRKGTGIAKVIISGGTVGPDTLAMPMFTGHVFGGGMGIIGDTTANGNPYIPNLAFVDSTYVNISGTAFIKGSVYGGSKNGHVFKNTHVMISGGQIGAGWDATNKKNKPAYSEDQWNAAVTAVANGDAAAIIAAADAMPECNSWPYASPYAPYDKFAGTPGYDSKEGATTGSDGHTYYGNVYGGGSGYLPYAAGQWVRTAGRVNGSTKVEITGGHIMTSVYGGNEITDVVGDSCVVIMTGGTLGVPRTLARIDDHPVTCYLFGAGKGDSRTLFNEWSNVKNTRVEVSGGRVFGSVFGGGEDGHVEGNAVVNIKSGAKIGTWGTSYVDGNIFGGGRGFTGMALTAGVICGEVNVNITGGEVLGSIYGGGRLAPVGTRLVAENAENYGWIQDDGNHGVIRVNISGGTIGNDREFLYVPANTSNADRIAMQNSNYIPHTDFDESDNKIVRTNGGNVFGGCMGRTTKLNGDINPLWPSLAVCRETYVTISGDAVIKGSVYGGGESGTVRDTTFVDIKGGTIGSPVMIHRTGKPDSVGYYFGSVFGGGYGSYDYSVPAVALQYHTRRLIRNDANHHTHLPAAELAGRVYGNTEVLVEGGQIYENVFGGGDLASIGTRDYTKSLNDTNCLYTPTDAEFNAGIYKTRTTGNTKVTVTGGQVGPLDHSGMNGYVYAAGKGIGNDPDEHFKDFCNVGNATLTVTGGKIWGSLFGGGADCHVLGNTTINVHSGADFGTDGTTTYDGNIFGGGRNYLHTNSTAGRVAGNVTITMDGGTMMGTIFGGGRMAMTGVDSAGKVDAFVSNGKYDSVHHGLVTINVSGGSIGNPDGYTLLTGSDESVGDIFGSGKGDTKDKTREWAGRVMNTRIMIKGDTRVYGSVFGGGEMAGIGWWDNSGVMVDGTGSSVVIIKDTLGHSPEIGTDMEFRVSYHSDTVAHDPDSWTILDDDGSLIHTCTGNVFGASQGDVELGTQWANMARSRESHVVIEGGIIKGSVFGGSEQGTVMGSTHLVVTGGTIGTIVGSGNGQYAFGDIYGGGYGSDDDSENGQAHGSPELIAGRVYGNTYVDVLDGTIRGDVYGGAEMAYIGTDGNANTGIILLNIGDSTRIVNGNDIEYIYTGEAHIGTDVNGRRLGGNVYGGNNIAGSATGKSYVNIFKTYLSETDSAINWRQEILPDATYALKNVFGGSNRADFTGSESHVAFFGCYNSSERVFGGGNAAASKNVFTEIQGGRFDNVFGGGNGELGPQYAADINGNVSLAIHGGRVNKFFVGSNENGTIHGNTNVIVDNNGPCGSFDVDEFFCGGNYVDYHGDIDFTVTCESGMAVKRLYGGCKQADLYGNINLNLEGGHFDYVYGGSEGRLADPDHGIEFKDAEVRGNVTLTLRGGTIDSAAFGGSHLIGTIHGSILVNVDDAKNATCPLVVHKVYGGGNLAAYGSASHPGSITVNVKNGTVSQYRDTVRNTNGDITSVTLVGGGNVFGGGYGAEAVVTGTTNVVIGNGTSATSKAVVEGDLYGGGDSTGVTGSTALTIQKDNSEIHGDVYGGSNKWGTVSANTAVTITGGNIGVEGSPGGGTVFGGGNGKNTEVTGKANVDISGKTSITRDVFGGGNEGEVKGGAEVKIH